MMKQSLTAIVLVLAMSGSAFAQATQDHKQHHPGGPTQTHPAPAPPPAAAAPPAQGQMPGQMMQGMPEQCRSMMQNMQTCMGTMHQMMQQGRTAGGMMGGGMMGQPAAQPAPAASPQTTTPSPATKAYLEAAERMHVPMMDGVQASDPDVAFVRGMIPHHQAAIDMAKVVLQYGKDPQTKKLAEDVVREQQREINDMQEWLKKNSR